MTATIKHTNPKALRSIYERMKTAGSRVVAVGYPAGYAQAYPDGTPVAEVAAQNVFGDPGMNIPARDFMSQARPGMMKWQKTISEKVNEQPLVTTQIEALLNTLGEKAVVAIKDAIINGTYKPLSEYTLEKRLERGNASDTPLIDTSHMIRSTTYVVRDKD